MSVVAAGKLNNLVASGETASEPNARHRSFGPTINHAHFLNCRHPGTNQLCHFHFQWIRNSEAYSLLCCFGDGVGYGLRGMTENRRSPRPHIINQLATVDVPDVGTLGAIDKEGFSTDAAKCAHGRVHTTGDSPAGVREQPG